MNFLITLNLLCIPINLYLYLYYLTGSAEAILVGGVNLAAAIGLWNAR
jgi:hypothetical protein